MASISFAVLQNDTIGSGISGSGLGFYGSGGFGTSVPLLNYQGNTFVTNSDGTIQGPAAINIKYRDDIVSSGCEATAIAQTGLLSKLNGSEATLVINFEHNAAVKVQNAQLRIYDRNNIDNPASGVVTKVAEIVNTDGKAYDTWVSNMGTEFSAVTGSGDALWWGAPWPDSVLYPGFGSGPDRPYYQNSVGVKFYNFTSSQDSAGSGNPDSRLSALAPPGKQTVGGSGLIVPLLDSPGSGGRGVAPPLHTGAPKFAQYINTTAQSTVMGASATYNSGTYLASMYGGTGYDTRHTWRVALSAAPTTIGSRLFSCLISLEYL
jgi:hypothetical protein